MIEQNDQRQREAAMLDALVAQHLLSQNRTRVVNKQPSLLEMPSDAIRGLLGAMQQFGGAADKQIDYYLGPTGIPDKLRTIAPYLDPGFYSGGNALADIIDPRASASDQFAASRTLSEMAALAPLAFIRGAGGNPIPGLLDELPTRQQVKETARNFMADESGALRLFHGSPHDFDRFSMSKIGTGEGAQAYGHGLYFAENEGIARSYRDALSARAAPNDARGNAFDLVQRMGGDEAATAEILRDAIANTPSPNTQQFLTDTLRHIEEKTYSDFERPLGRMYEVNVNANPEDFLDWDLPLSQQPKSVRDALGPRVDALRQAGAGLPQDPVGEMLWRVAHPQGGFDKTDFSRSVPEQATERLREAGIPGIRYLDAGSRGAGDGSRNYVVFDENLIEIVRKYGIAGAAAMLGMSQADVAQAMQQQPQPQGLLTGPQ